MVKYSKRKYNKSKRRYNKSKRRYNKSKRRYNKSKRRYNKSKRRQRGGSGRHRVTDQYNYELSRVSREGDVGYANVGEVPPPPPNKPVEPGQFDIEEVTEMSGLEVTTEDDIVTALSGKSDLEQLSILREMLILKRKMLQGKKTKADLDKIKEISRTLRYKMQGVIPFKITREAVLLSYIQKLEDKIGNRFDNQGDCEEYETGKTRVAALLEKGVMPITTRCVGDDENGWTAHSGGLTTI